MADGSYTIGELSRQMGLSPRTIDYYTRQGLLHPGQSEPGHGYRHYTEGDRHRIALIKQLQARKLSLQEIRRVLDAGSRSASAAMETMEHVALELERLRGLVQKTETLPSALEQPAMRAIATEALQRATALSSLLVSLLQEMPLT